MSFTALALPINLVLFAVAAMAVWLAGVRLSKYADTISRKTGIGQALIGLLLLAGITSLPEIGVSVSAAATGNPDLAVNNLFGSIAMQVTVLAIIDFAVGRSALTSVVPSPSLLLLGALNILMLAIAAAGMVVGDVAIIGIGAWSWGCLFAYVLCVWLLAESRGRQPWLATDLQNGTETTPPVTESGERARLPRALIVRTVSVAAVILIAGFIVSQAGDAIARQTGLGSSFVGFVLVAISTSLPEFSTALSAARLGRFTMAISDILGTNLINVALLFVVDAVAAGDAILNQTDSFAAFGTVLGIIVTSLFLIGLAERRDRTILRMGVDSIAVLITYVGGLTILFNLR